ncbi:MAG: rhodanese-like domain-containing protein [Verrucomicrobiota bacterium]
MKNLLRDFGVIVFVVALLGVTAFFLDARLSQLFLYGSTASLHGIPEVSVEEALSWESGSGVTWIDARSKKEFEEGHVPHSFLLSEASDVSWEESFFELMASGSLAEDRPVVVYCASDSCDASGRVAVRLKDLMDEGVIPTAEVYVLANGWEAWQAR